MYFYQKNFEKLFLEKITFKGRLRENFLSQLYKTFSFERDLYLFLISLKIDFSPTRKTNFTQNTNLI